MFYRNSIRLEKGCIISKCRVKAASGFDLTRRNNHNFLKNYSVVHFWITNFVVRKTKEEKSLNYPVSSFYHTPKYHTTK